MRRLSPFFVLKRLHLQNKQAHMLHPDLLSKLPALREFLAKHRVKSACIFGSATGDNFRADSDIDLLISFQEPLDSREYAQNFWSLYLNLPRLLGRQVDIVVEEDLKNPYFIEEVNETKISIYESKSQEILV